MSQLAVPVRPVAYYAMSHYHMPVSH